MKKLRNIGIFAHVDAGKTTLTEQLLSHAGAIRTVGSVDAGTTHSDTLPVERRRGISVKATCVSFDHQDTQINLIDTPGHVDFTAEVERSLWALDAAVLVVCSVEGVQPQTELLFSALHEKQIPVIFFLNKIDRDGADPQQVLAQIHRLLSSHVVGWEDTEAITELVCDFDEELMEQYLLGEEIQSQALEQAFVKLTRQGLAYPVYQGSALRNQGVQPLLDAIVHYLPAPKTHADLCGVIFAAEQDKTLGRGVWVRLFGGSLETREAITLPNGLDPLTGQEKTQSAKITQIRDAHGNPVGKLSA